MLVLLNPPRQDDVPEPVFLEHSSSRLSHMFSVTSYVRINSEIVSCSVFGDKVDFIHEL